MMKRVLCCLVAGCSLSLFAWEELGAPFTDGAVLQRGMKVPVWGASGPCKAPEQVTVEFAGQKKTVMTGPHADVWKWRVDLDPMEASAEPRTMTVSFGLQSKLAGESKKIEVRNVVVGEVWFAAGQSNMECPIWGSNTRYRDAKGGMMTAMTRLPLVRYVKVPRKWSPEPQKVAAQWRAFVPEDLQNFAVAKTNAGKPNRNSLSAVAFYYARELYLALGIPVGIVEASWGGTNIDAWTPRCGYENCDPCIKETADYEVKGPDTWKPTDKKGPIWGSQQQPTVLWNGMVDAFTPMAVRGFIWYQGCTNSGEPQLYTAKMHALYNGWSKAFENPALKLYFVELAPYETSWAGLCAAQEKFVDEQPNAALAVTSDVGNFDDIHPNNKEIVSKRLVVHALKRDYGFDIPQDNSPRFKSVSFDGAKATLAFDNVKDWYVYAPNRSREAAFEVCGTNGVWQAAKILNFRKDVKDGKESDTDYIDGSEIVVSSEKVAAPVKVRYLGKNRTAGTMYNEVSLPLGVFVTK